MRVYDHICVGWLIQCKSSNGYPADPIYCLRHDYLATTPMAVLQDLAVEVISEIFSYLDCVNLGNLCLVSRLSNLIAERLLYKVVPLSGSRREKTPITPFLRAILNRPTLARHVQLLHLGWWTLDTVPDPDSCPQIVQDNTLFTSASNSLGLPQQPWTEEAQAFLLLHLLPNLQDLNIDGSPMLQKLIEDSLTAPIECLPVGLKSLRRFCDNGIDEPARVTPIMLLALMRLPCIREIITDMEAVHSYTHDSNAVAKLISSAQHRGRSTVTKLSLEYGGFCTSLLERILQVPRVLTHFSYEDFSELDTSQITTFRAALRHLRPTLQYLSLGWVDAVEVQQPNEDDGESGIIGSLHDWPALRVVDCGLVALVGRPQAATSRLVDVVPRVIRELKVHQMYPDHVFEDLYNSVDRKQWT